MKIITSLNLNFPKLWSLCQMKICFPSTRRKESIDGTMAVKIKILRLTIKTDHPVFGFLFWAAELSLGHVDSAWNLVALLWLLAEVRNFSQSHGPDAGLAMLSSFSWWWNGTWVGFLDYLGAGAIESRQLVF